MSTIIRDTMSNNRKRLAGALVLLMLLVPITNAATTSWSGPSTVNTAGGETSLTGFRVPGNATILDGWAHITDSPMAASTTSPDVMDISAFEDGELSGMTTDYIAGNLTLVDDGSLNVVNNLDIGNYSINMNSRYNQGPASGVLLLLESVSGYIPHPSCNGLRGYNLTSGYDEGFNGQLDAEEVLNVDYLCTTYQTVQGGNGRAQNGSVVNGSFVYIQAPVAEGNSTCQFGGKSFTWGNDYGLYYDEDTSLNSTETEATLYFCNRDTCLLYTSDAADE